MYENLFKRPTTLDRYRKGPLPEAREQYLKQCTAEGYSHSMLRKIAWILLSVAHSINIDHGKVTKCDIELAVDSCTQLQPSPEKAPCALQSRQLFVHITTAWMCSLGYFEPLCEVTSPFDSQITAYARYLHEERGLSPVTISTGCERISWFFKSLQSSQNSLQKISFVDVNVFIEEKGNQGWKRSSLASLASSLRNFFRYAEDQRQCTPGITAAIESPRIYAQEGLPEGPNWKDVQLLLAKTRGARPADIRDHAILMLLAIYGLRRGEVSRLQLDDFDWESGRVMVSRPKQNRIQCYPLLSEVGEAIVRYLCKVRASCAHRSLFLTLAAPVRPLSAESITQIARARLNSIGVKLPHRGAHCLRHACACHLLSSGFSLKEIGDHLGHRTANSTLIYTKIDLAGLRQVAEIDLKRIL